MTQARREKTVLAHSRANLKGRFVKNGRKRAFKAVKGERVV